GPPRAALDDLDPLRVDRGRRAVQRVPGRARPGAVGDARAAAERARRRGPARTARARYAPAGGGVPDHAARQAARACAPRARAAERLAARHRSRAACYATPLAVAAVGGVAAAPP